MSRHIGVKPQINKENMLRPVKAKRYHLRRNDIETDNWFFNTTVEARIEKYNVFQKLRWKIILHKNVYLIFLIYRNSENIPHVILYSILTPWVMCLSPAPEYEVKICALSLIPKT